MLISKKKHEAEIAERERQHEQRLAAEFTEQERQYESRYAIMANLLANAETERDKYRFDAEARKGYWDTITSQFLVAKECVESLTQENEQLIAAGAKLADELAELRKAPEIEGMAVRLVSGEEIYIRGCAFTGGGIGDDGEMWRIFHDRIGNVLTEIRADQVIALTPNRAAPKTTPKRGKK